MDTTYSLEDILMEFGKYLLLDKECSKSTLHQYLGYLKKVIPEKILDEQLVNYKIESQEDYYDAFIEIIDNRMKKINEWAGTTSARDMAVTVVHTFYRFLNEKKGIEVTHRYEMAQRKIPPLNIITDEQFGSLMSVIPRNEFYNARDRAIFSLMFYAGLKEFEITNLGYQDFKRAGGRITHVFVHGENEDQEEGRKVPIDRKVAEEIYKYEELYSQCCNNLSTKLKRSYFRNNEKTGISERSIRRKLTKWTKLSGVRADPSSLRHSYGVRLAAEGKSTHELAYLMGLMGNSYTKSLFERYKKYRPKKS